MAQKHDVQHKTTTDVEPPKMYKVIMLNDDFTSMDFVISVLVQIFSKSPAEATQIMLTIHEKGQAVVAVYPLDIAKTKVELVRQNAKLNEFPLRCVYEEA